jgi:CO dehydrogenase/acetyl-CoA synthase beta subunit
MAEITTLDAEIAGYKKDYDGPTTSEVRKVELLDTITERGRTLNRLLDQQSAGKFCYPFWYFFTPSHYAV